MTRWHFPRGRNHAQRCCSRFGRSRASRRRGGAAPPRAVAEPHPEPWALTLLASPGIYPLTDDDARVKPAASRWPHMAEAPAEAPAQAPASQMPVASAAGMIADNASRFLSNSSGSGSKSDVSSASLGSLVELNFDKLQGTIAFLVESVRVLAGAAQRAAENEERQARLEASLKEVRENQQALINSIEEQAAEAERQEKARMEAMAGEDKVGTSVVLELDAKITALQDKTEGLAGDHAQLRSEFDQFKLFAEELQHSTQTIEQSIEQTNKLSKQGDEEERRALAAEIARVEAEIARLAAMRAEDQAAAKRTVKPTKSSAAAEKVAAEKAKKAAVWLDGVWDTTLGGTSGVVLKVTDGEGLYGNKASHRHLPPMLLASPLHPHAASGPSFTHACVSSRRRSVCTSLSTTAR